MIKVLLTGSSSLLGKALLETAPPDIKLSCTYHIYCPVPAWWLDVTNKDTIKRVFDTVDPDVVIHCSAAGDVDFAERSPEESALINVLGTSNIVEACRKHNSKLVYLSTNAVFDGEGSPYSETDERNPVNEYGRIKVRAENEVVELPDWLIVRPILLYGWPYRNSRSNFVTRVIDKLQKNEEVLASSDTFTQPTYVKDCATAIWKMLGLRGQRTGLLYEKAAEFNVMFTSTSPISISNQIIHVAPEEKCSLFDLAFRTAATFELFTSRVKAVPSSHFETLAPRPRDTTYDLTKLKSLGISCRGITDGLKAMREDL